MRGQQTFKIEGFKQPIEIYELTLKQIMELFQFKGLDEIKSWSSIVGYVQEKVIPLATNLTPEDILSFAPSELQEIWNVLKEVNKVFFGLTRTPAVKAVFGEIKPQIVAAFGDSFAGLSKLGMLTPDSMDTLISSMQSTKTKKSKPKK